MTPDTWREHPAIALMASRRLPTVRLAIDPGPERSAWLAYVSGDGDEIIGFGIESNPEVLSRIRRFVGGMMFPGASRVVIEKIESFGMAVGAEVFETVFWSGRFAQAADPMPVERVTRRAVKLHLCGSSRAKDANIRAALLDRYGPGKEKAVGTKANPGPLYGISKDVWSALAVAVTAADTLP